MATPSASPRGRYLQQADRLERHHGSGIEGQDRVDHRRVQGDRPWRAPCPLPPRAATCIWRRENRELLETVRRTIRAAHSGVDVSLHAVDLRDRTALHDLAKACGDSDILVNNAGDIPGGTIESLDESKWRHAWELKVFGYINLTRELFRNMKARKARRHRQHHRQWRRNTRPSSTCAAGAAQTPGWRAFTKGMGKGSREHGVRRAGRAPALYPAPTASSRS